MIRKLLVVLFLAGAIALADSSLGGVTITNVKTDLSNLTVSFTITNTTDKLLNAWGVKIGSFYGVDAAWSEYVADRANNGPRADGSIPPGGHLDLTERLSKVSVRRGEEWAFDKFDPTSGDVVMLVAVFDDNRAFGPARDLDYIEKTRSLFLRIAIDQLATFDELKKAPDYRAYLHELIDNLPKPSAPDPNKNSEQRNADFLLEQRDYFLRETLRQVQELWNPAKGRADLISAVDALSQWPALAKTKLEGHMKLIRVEQAQ